MPAERLALLTTHFGNPFWVALLLRRVGIAFPDLPRERTYVIDQDRTEDSADRLRDVLGPVHVLRYPRSDAHHAMTGHDHAHVLNLAAREIECDLLMIFDSDAHPIGPDAGRRVEHLLERNDALLAASGPTGTQTHPCFMVFGPRVDRSGLLFDAGQLDHAVDTGRELYGQVQAMGLVAKLLRPEPAFGGLWGTHYLGGSIYHHGSGSFDSSPDSRLQSQYASWRHDERFFRRKVERGIYRVNVAESSLLQGRRRVNRERSRVLGAVRRRLAR